MYPLFAAELRVGALDHRSLRTVVRQVIVKLAVLFDESTSYAVSPPVMQLVVPFV